MAHERGATAVRPRRSRSAPKAALTGGAAGLADPAGVARARAERCSDSELRALADAFQLLASPVRLEIVHALSQRELCVCDLAHVVGASVSAVSHHLRQLRQMRLVRYRRHGRMAFYRLDDAHVAKLFEMGLEHVREELGERD